MDHHWNLKCISHTYNLIHSFQQSQDVGRARHRVIKLSQICKLRPSQIAWLSLMMGCLRLVTLWGYNSSYVSYIQNTVSTDLRALCLSLCVSPSPSLSPPPPSPQKSKSQMLTREVLAGKWLYFCLPRKSMKGVSILTYQFEIIFPASSCSFVVIMKTLLVINY